MLDKTKIPSGLVVNRVWAPDDERVHRRPIAYATEPRRRIAGAGMLALGVILGVAVAVGRGPFWLAFASLLVAWAGVAFAGGGRTGFYEVDDDGGLGAYLGRSRPEAGAMRPGKPGG